MISVACSSYFQRTAASLVVSYLLILPLALLGVLVWISLELQGIAAAVADRDRPAGDRRRAICIVLFREHERPAAASAGCGQRRQGSRRPGAGSADRPWGW